MQTKPSSLTSVNLKLHQIRYQTHLGLMHEFRPIRLIDSQLSLCLLFGTGCFRNQQTIKASKVEQLFAKGLYSRAAMQLE